MSRGTTRRLERIDSPDRRRVASQLDRTLWVALIAAVIGLACAVVALVGPANIERTRVTWRPARDGLDRPLALLGAYPQRLSTTLDCSTVRVLTGETTLVRTAANPTSSGALTLVANTDEVHVGIGQDARLLSLSVPRAGSCSIAARFVALDDPGRLSLRVGSRTVARTVPRVLLGALQTEASWPRVVGLHADSFLRDRPDVIVKLDTTPTGSSPSTRQIVAELLALIALAVALAGVLRRSALGKSNSQSGGTSAVGERSSLVALSDVFVATLACVALACTPTFWDDGWVRATIGGYSKLGSFSNYYTQADYPQPLGYWWSWLTHAWSGGEQTLVVLRIAPLLLIVFSWWLLRREVVDMVVPAPERRLARGVAALVFGVGSAAFLMTLRPEPLIALLLTLAIIAVFRFSQHPGPRPLAALVTVVALAVTAHQTGWVVALSALALIPSVVRWCTARDRLARAISLVVVGLVGLTLAVLLLGLDSDLHLIRSGAASFRAGAPYKNGVLDLATTRFKLLDDLNLVGLQRLWPVFAVVIAGTFLAVGYGVRSRGARLVGYSALAGYGGLLLTGSPWPWHFGALVPGAAVLASLSIVRVLALRRAAIPALLVLGVATSASLDWAMRSGGQWTAGDLAGHTWAALPHLNLWEWAALGGIGAALGAILARRSVRSGPPSHGAVLGASLLLLLTPVALTWGLLLTDAAEASSWSYTRQALRELSGRDRCGIGDFLPVVTDATPLTEARIDRWTLSPATPDGYPLLSTAAVKPHGAPVWGTYQVSPDDVDGSSPTATVATPWFDVRRTRDVVFWTIGRLGTPDALRVELVVGRAGDTNIVRLPAEAPIDTTWWAFHRVDQLPHNARALRLVMTHGAAGSGAWLAATAPVAPRFVSFTAATAGRAVWRNPVFVLALPCRPLPSVNRGVVTPFRWSLDAPSRHAEAAAAEYGTIEEGCIHPKRRTGRLCAFEFIAPP